MESIALIPVCSGSYTDLLSQIPGAGLSIGLYSDVTIGPAPSIGCPSAFTTRPIIASPTGTDTTLPVRFTVWPSPIFSSEPNNTITFALTFDAQTEVEIITRWGTNHNSNNARNFYNGKSYTNLVENAG